MSIGGGHTTLGGANRDFPSTCWSRFSGSANLTPEDRTASLDALARAYWKPIYAYVRSRFAKSNEDAKDLTQDFFAWIASTDFLTHADPAKGRFRAFVKTSLQNFFYNDERKSGRQKRGGGKEFFSVQGEEVPEIADSRSSPEELLDDVWRAELFARAVDRLEADYAAGGKADYFRVFSDFYLGEAGATNYKDVSGRYGISESNVSNYLIHAKRRFREIVSTLVAETVGNEEDLRGELQALFGPDWK